MSTKRESLENPESCWNRADMDEEVFILLARDVVAPATIRDWVERRIGFGRNRSTDAQLLDALRVAEKMANTQKKYQPRD